MIAPLSDQVAFAVQRHSWALAVNLLLCGSAATGCLIDEVDAPGGTLTLPANNTAAIDTIRIEPPAGRVRYDLRGLRTNRSYEAGTRGQEDTVCALYSLRTNELIATDDDSGENNNCQISFTTALGDDDRLVLTVEPFEGTRTDGVIDVYLRPGVSGGLQVPLPKEHDSSADGFSLDSHF